VLTQASTVKLRPGRRLKGRRASKVVMNGGPPGGTVAAFNLQNVGTIRWQLLDQATAVRCCRIGKSRDLFGVKRNGLTDKAAPIGQK
jgi:hypothetical protein